MKKVGYACLNLDTDSNFKTCRLANLTEKIQKDLIKHNLKQLEKLLLYNEKNGIELFRISSDLIPFASSVHNKVDWEIVFKDRLKELGLIAKRSNQRLSMHPGQYTVLNSNNPQVVENGVKDLIYHASVLELLGTKESSKIILHIGGVYGDKDTAIDRFIENYKLLPELVKKRLVIENDDKSYNILDAINLANTLSIPVIFDNLHHEINPPDYSLTEFEWIDLASKTWNDKDGAQKIHYSEQALGGLKGAHSSTISALGFNSFINNLCSKEIDIMLEVKDKNRSAVKCDLIINPSKPKLESEWAKYKYLVLEKSNGIYLEIRELLKASFPNPVEFYGLVDKALISSEDKNASINALEHVWGYFKNVATKIEKESFFKQLESYKKSELELKKIKRTLQRLARKYNINYLLSSYYFLY